MRIFSEKSSNSTGAANLYCVWVPVHNDTGDRLVAVWIDPAMTAFQPFATEVSNGIDGAAAHFAGRQEEDVCPFTGEHVTPILPPHC